LLWGIKEAGETAGTAWCLISIIMTDRFRALKDNLQ
jgi:hypothetical protein